MKYCIKLRFNIDLDIDDVNDAQDIISKLSPEEILSMCDGAVNVDVEEY